MGRPVRTSAPGRTLSPALRTAIPVGGIALLVYGLTMAPTAFGLDSAELATAAYTLGLAHSPGYSVYLLVAHVFSRLPFGEVALRINLLSAVAGAAAVAGLAYHLRRTGVAGYAAVAAGLALAFSYYAWSVSVVAEVYTFQALLLVLLIHAVWEWRESGRYRILMVAAVLAGAALANNPATLLWWPGLLVLLWDPDRWRHIDAGKWAGLTLALLAGLAMMLYIPWSWSNDPAFVYAGNYNVLAELITPDLGQWRNLVWYLTGQQFAGFFPGLDPLAWIQGAFEFAGHLWAAWLGVGVILGLLGIYTLWQRKHTWLLGLLLIFGLHAGFFASYGAQDSEFMFLPSLLVWSILMASGMQIVVDALDPSWRPVALLLPFVLLLVNWSFVDLSSTREPAQTARARLAAVEPDSLYIAAWGDAAVLHYMQHVEGLGEEIKVVNVFFVPEQGLEPMIKLALAQDRPVYSSQSELLPSGFFAVRSGLSFQVIMTEGGEDGSR